MGSIRLIQKPENGKLIINVPDDMRDETIVIEFRPAQKDELEHLSLAEVSRQLFDKLPKPKPDFDWDSINVYEQ
ncbi:MAG TPA: hypothetical protein VGA96_05580 [Fibrella sp.]|jgi:hypothetical protein